LIISKIPKNSPESGRVPNPESVALPPSRLPRGPWERNLFLDQGTQGPKNYMQDTQLATDIVIGILGEYDNNQPFRRRRLTSWTRIVALQGAFAEHQAILQKISGKGHLEVIQVRTPEELKRCDALIIPGGGLSISNEPMCSSDPTPPHSIPPQSQLPSHYLHVYLG